MSFEVLEHTADIGFRAWGDSCETMIENASAALVFIALDPDVIEPREAFPIAAMGEDRETLLVNWLNEVLYYIDGRLIALRRFQVQRLEETEAAGLAWGEPRSETHHARLIVKGVTYHQLKIERLADKWQCEVYLDI
jgi:SHS2 domain-containing protein